MAGRLLARNRLICRCITNTRRFSRGSIYHATNGESAPVPSRSRVVVCGGGIVGASVAYHLAERGWTDVTVLEQGRLTCGTTWHAVGLVGQVRDTMSSTRLMGYGKQLYTKLDKQYGVGFKECGSITVAQTDDRMTLLRRSQALAKAAGVESILVTKSEIEGLCKWLNTEDVVGGLWIPGDGALTAPDLAIAYTKAAKTAGVNIMEGVKVNRINTDAGQVSCAETSHGDIRCEYFVNCSGQWGRNLGLNTNPPVNIPQHPMEHFYIVSQPIDGMDRMMPVVRDYDGLIYAREWSGGLMTGGFEPKGKPIFGDTMPDKFEFQLLPEDWDHFQVLMDGILNRFPVLQTTQIRQFVNGPESFTPDNVWNIGESAEVKNYFVASGMGSNGIAASGGLGRCMAELITGEQTFVNLSAADVKRHATQQGDIHYLAERCSETLGRYRLRYPDDQYKSARGLVVSPLHSQLLAAGACFGEDSAYEKPLWFSESQDVSDQYNAAEGTFGKPSWLEPVGSECMACRENVGVCDVSCYTKIAVKSADSEALNCLQKLCCSTVPGTVGAVTRTAMLNKHGGFELVCDVVTMATNSFILLCPTAQTLRCLTWIRRNTPDPGSVEITDISDQYSGLHLVGPGVMGLLSEVVGDKCLTGDPPLLMSQNSSKTCDMGSIKDTIILRQNLSGESSVTALIPAKGAVEVYDSLMRLGKSYGIRNIGHHTLRCLQTTTGCPQWLKDFTSSATPFVTGMADMIDFQKEDFIGKDALLSTREDTESSVVLLELGDFCMDTDPWIWGGEPIYKNGTIAGSVSSTGYDFSRNKLLCMGTVSGQPLATDLFQVDASGKSHQAIKIQYDPFSP